MVENDQGQRMRVTSRSCAAVALSVTAPLAFGSTYILEPVEPLNFAGYNTEGAGLVQTESGGNYMLSIRGEHYLDPPLTVVVYAGVRHELPGFFGTDINDLGTACGAFTRGSAWGIPRVWSPATGYTSLPSRSPHSYPSVIAENGHVGGAVSVFNACIWRNGNQSLIVGAIGGVSAFGPNGVVAGHLIKGSHGNWTWLLDSDGLRYLDPEFSIVRIDSRERLIGSTSGYYGGFGLVYDEGSVTYLPGDPKSWIADMNDAGTGVGDTYNGEGKFRQPVVWFEKTPRLYLKAYVPDLIGESSWTDFRLLDIDGAGVIMGTAKTSSGTRWVIRLRPRS